MNIKSDVAIVVPAGARHNIRNTGESGSRVTRTDDGGVLSRSGPGGSGFVAAGDEGVYAGRDGNVYRRAEGGGWQKYENGSWGTAQRPDAVANAPDRATPPDSSTIGQLERDRSARIEGAACTRRSCAAGRRPPERRQLSTERGAWRRAATMNWLLDG
jgi:hypothetical protein